MGTIIHFPLKPTNPYLYPATLAKQRFFYSLDRNKKFKAIFYV